MVAIALDYARDRKVKRITLEIGQLSAVSSDAIRFCFDICCEGTSLAGTDLQIREIPGLARCRHCGSEISLAQPFGICGCGSTELEILQGEELKIKELEVEESCV